MRTDHFAYQQAVRVAGGGLLVQLVLGLVLLVYGRLAGDTAFVIASAYVLACLPIWIGLTIVFHQHRLERLEALEADELATSRGGEAAASSIFEKDGANVAARRLRFMHTWLMPAISLLVAITLIGAAWWIIQWFHAMDDADREIEQFSAGSGLGWQLAIAIALSLVAFILSRFVAGMSKQPAWQNLRGGAGAMVGNALVLLAIAIGIVFHFFQKPQVLSGISYGLAIFMIAVAAEILLNFVLNLYRPRRAHETPRPAFDSRILSLFAAPDSIVRSINEAVNYQFGFDITSSWGYQLLLRSVGRLALFGLAVLAALSCIAVIQPGQQALRLRFGKQVGSVYEQTAMLKLPWPFETAAIYDVSRVRELSLGNPAAPKVKYKAWGDEGELDPSRNLWIVASPEKRVVSQAASGLNVTDGRAGSSSGSGFGTTPATEPISALADQFAIIDSDLILSYRVRDNALDQWLEFCNDTKLRRGTLDMRERALRNLAMREVTQYLSTQPLNRVLSALGDSHALELQQRIQKSFDAMKTGVEVVSVAMTRVRPPGNQAVDFLEPTIAIQNARKVVQQQRSQVDTTMTAIIGSVALAAEVTEAIDALKATERRDADKARADAIAAGQDPKTVVVPDSPEAIEQRLVVERIINSTQAQAAALIANARNDRWRLHMDASRKAADVLGQAPSWNVDSELYRQRKLMEVLAAVMPSVRVKFVLGIDPERVRFDFDMQEGDTGLNIYDYVEKK